MSRVRYIAFRSVQTVMLLLFILTFLFFFFRMLPGSYADLMAFQGADEATVEAMKMRWGLNDPLYVQYYRYITNLLNGDAGMSLQFRVPVWEFVRMKIFNSLILVGPAITVGYLLGTLVGGYLGSKRGSKREKYGLVPLILTGSFPSFFTAIVFIIVFASWLNLVPTSGMFGFSNPYNSPEFAWWRPYFTKDFAIHYALPFLTIVARYTYLPALVMRTNVVEVLGQDFFYYHRMTGLPDGQRLKRLVNHAILPVITLYPISMTRAIGGLVVIEIVFNWPGIGYSLVQAVFARDFPVVQFVFFLVAAFVVIGNFVVDIIYGYIDPRVSVGES